MLSWSMIHTMQTQTFWPSDHEKYLHSLHVIPILINKLILHIYTSLDNYNFPKRPSLAVSKHYITFILQQLYHKYQGGSIFN